ncbi:MAG: hypothetical protein U0S49_07485 [Rhodospirillales bacterium]|nr:hypothetical protein [Rhodospirillales bacterium]
MAEPCDLGDLRDLGDLPLARLADMADAGGQIRECYRLLRKGGGNIVGEVLRGHGAFCDWEHYPPSDVYDDETHSQYYYHAHPGACRFVEHGHFHTFLRPLGMPAGIVPAAAADGGAGAADGFADNQAPSHLVAISMDEAGYPVRLFTTNRWVTGETWYRAEDVIRMLDRFLVDLAYPSLPVNIWISAMVRLFRPEIEALIRERDAVLAASAAAGAGPIHEDRAIEVVSSLAISVEQQVENVARALASRERR